MKPAVQAMPFAQRSKEQGAVRPEDHHPLPALRCGVMRKEKGVRRPWLEAHPGNAMRVAQRSTLTRNLNGKPRDALGRRAAEGVPDSQSASEGRERAKPERAA